LKYQTAETSTEKRDLGFRRGVYEILRGVDWQILTNISEKPTGPILKVN
jgi:hypothetical protein